MIRALATALAVVAVQAADAQETVTLGISESDEYGEFLTVNGLPVYLFSTDLPGNPSTPPTLTCTGECLATWPPVVGISVEPGEGVDPDLVGAIESEGLVIATYNGWPLYFFLRDTERETPTGQEFESFGGEWYLMGPDGVRIEGKGV
jgi:predicted lipoprotein with Yx(FWY)xxD motif